MITLQVLLNQYTMAEMTHVWFGRDANYHNIKSTLNVSYSSIDFVIEVTCQPAIKLEAGCRSQLLLNTKLLIS